MKLNQLATILLCLSVYHCILCAQEPIFRYPSSYIQGFIVNDSMPMSSLNYNGFRIYFNENSYSARHLPELKSELDAACHRILNVLDIPSYPYGSYLIAVDSEEEMKQLMGYHIKGGAAQGHDLVFFVYNDSIRPQFRHEIFHLYAYETWGPASSRMLDEGGATYTDNYCFYDNPMYSINAYYLKENMLFSLTDLVHSFDVKAKENDVIAYIQSAGIFKYLYEKYGPLKLKTLWTRGFEALYDIYGMTLDQLETAWKLFIETIPVPEGFDIHRLKDGCG